MIINPFHDYEYWTQRIDLAYLYLNLQRCRERKNNSTKEYRKARLRWLQTIQIILASLKEKQQFGNELNSTPTYTINKFITSCDIIRNKIGKIIMLIEQAEISSCMFRPGHSIETSTSLKQNCDRRKIEKMILKYKLTVYYHRCELQGLQNYCRFLDYYYGILNFGDNKSYLTNNNNHKRTGFHYLYSYSKTAWEIVRQNNLTRHTFKSSYSNLHYASKKTPTRTEISWVLSHMLFISGTGDLTFVILKLGLNRLLDIDSNVLIHCIKPSFTNLTHSKDRDSNFDLFLTYTTLTLIALTQHYGLSFTRRLLRDYNVLKPFKSKKFCLLTHSIIWKTLVNLSIKLIHKKISIINFSFVVNNLHDQTPKDIVEGQRKLDMELHSIFVLIKVLYCCKPTKE
eukprot:gnl/TRDRNA2_/TRDRNA2_176882_c0_seq1.p1 gnl/TRDRNA2_/TRDRNA2_176882_c0~~gnl/TRDRNA2_/TRDRNA2_176882_c0_seq1.p1  ORF type:complete len:398 (+),score=-60.32 gnl/TRDRNA2_/TRDRNA2_176882_c0_seq1:102-1295(+)